MGWAFCSLAGRIPGRGCSACVSILASGAAISSHCWSSRQRECAAARPPRSFAKQSAPPSVGSNAAAARHRRTYLREGSSRAPLTHTRSVCRSRVPRRHSISIIIPAPMPSGPICFHLVTIKGRFISSARAAFNTSTERTLLETLFCFNIMPKNEDKHFLAALQHNNFNLFE